VKTGFVGELRHVQAFNMTAAMADSSTPLSQGRNSLELYGPYNAAQLGLTYDVLTPYAGHATRVLAQRAFFTPERPETPGGPMAKTPYPDEVTAISEHPNGVVVTNVLNWAAHFAASRVELYGSEGTIVNFQRGDLVMAARKGEEQLATLPIPPEHDGLWLVEDEFVRLCRGEIDEPSFTFRDGVKNMEYLEACYYSAVEGRWVDLPA
jgi:predicted dehydrogenase